MGCLSCLLLLLFVFHSQLVTCSSSPSSSSSPSPSPIPSCHPQQSSTLLQFKNSLFISRDEVAAYFCDYYGIAYYPKTESWENGTDCCAWDGVTCDKVTGHVIGIDLSCSWLQGTIQPNNTLFFFHHLQRLNLAFNNFSGSPIPSQFGRFTNMTHLNLTHSWFAGKLPSEISHLSKLVSLDLSRNYDLRLETPSFKRLIQNLTKLSEFVMSYVDMSSVVPGSFMNLSSSLTSLQLFDCGLRGRLPNKTFHHSPNLQLLDLRYNYGLTGSLPKYNWSSPLRYLALSHTEISIELPNSIRNLKSLSELYLGSCNIIGSYPVFLGNLTQITSLDLSNHSFGGQIPWSLLNLEHLTYLNLAYNNYIGQLPNSFTNLTQLSFSSNFSKSQLVSPIPSNLRTLALSGNSLNGTIPSWLYNLPSLANLWLYSNQLAGYIGEFQYNSLECLSLSKNNLHGPIPKSISKLSNLWYLDLSSNNLSGIVEFDMFSKLKHLQWLTLSFNGLSVRFNKNSNITLPFLYSLEMSSCNVSEFPYSSKSLTSLQRLDLSNNQIIGNIQTSLWDGGTDLLYYLNLSHNSLTSMKHLPWKTLEILDLSSNLLQGPLPIPSPTTYFFSVSKNNLTGNIPFLICNTSTLSILDLSHNHLNGTIPSCLVNFSDSLSVLDLQMNKFHGTIPATFAKGNTLRSLHLNGNQLEGSLPRSLVNCRNLEVLDVGDNKMNGTLPHWLGTLPKLQVLVLRSNRFQGPIANPKLKFPFPNLRIMDLSHNEFCGLLPTKYFKHLKAMMSINADNVKLKYMGQSYYQDSMMVEIKGFYIEMMRILTFFTTIDLSNNSFTGEIPELIGKLKSLKGLNFSHNNLTGYIPRSFENLTNLEWLDLSSNKLIGTIPEQLANITQLEVLNLSQNQLVGPIPRGNQFNTFTNDSYSGNLGLCGFPLSKTCINNEGQQPPPSLTFPPEDELKFENGFNWKVVLLGYGCGMIFGLSMGCIVFSSGKPKWLVKMIEGERYTKVKKSRKNARRNTKGRRICAANGV